ncbi:MAG: MinD/ParA family protein [Nitrospinota bacterium]|nr:MinD/ParA family protein [Nitrospinota bacterium]
MDQAGTLRKMATSAEEAGTEKQHIKGIAVASGKGGVGKTNIVANTAFELCRKGKKVLVFDADMGLGNIHILLGLAPKYNIGHVLTGSKKLRDILVEGPGGIAILPASTGNKKYSEITTEEKLVLKTELEILQKEFDYIIFDIGAGISANVMFFCSAVEDVVVIATPEPTSFSDAYAIMKVLSRDYLVKKFKLLVNMCYSRKEAISIFQRLVMVADKFGLGIKIDFLGHIIDDDSVSKAVRKQQLVCNTFPNSESSKCIINIADTLEKTLTGGEISWANVFNGSE